MRLFSRIRGSLFAHKTTKKQMVGMSWRRKQIIFFEKYFERLILSQNDFLSQKRFGVQSHKTFLFSLSQNVRGRLLHLSRDDGVDVARVCARELRARSTPRRPPPWCRPRARLACRSRSRSWQCPLGTTDLPSHRQEDHLRHPESKKFRIQN